jgi:O-methyltransferase
MLTSFPRAVARFREVLGLQRAKSAKGARTDQGHPDFGVEIRRTVGSVAPYTMTSPERIHALVTAVEYVIANDIPGDIVECGVWRGGSMMAVAETLVRLGKTNRRLYLFDTFEGMPPPAETDVNFRGEAAADLMSKAERDTAWVWAVAQLEDVKERMRSTGYPEDLIEYVEGKVEDTIPREAPEQVAILRLDTDWYQSTKHEMKHLYPRLSPGGVLIVDDYGHWEGAKKAVDEYIVEERVRCLLCRVDYTGRIAVKQ